MKIIYLLNTYPVPSGTFIRNEIESIEKFGMEVTRLSVRHFKGELIDKKDIGERNKTKYLLDGNIRNLIVSAAKEIFLNPFGILRAVPTWYSLTRADPRNWVRHIAYLIQAFTLRQTAQRIGAVHVHSHFSNNATAVAMLSHLIGGPSYSFTAHGPDEFLSPQKQNFKAKIKNAAFVVAISEYCRETLNRVSGSNGMSGKIQIARCGINIAEFKMTEPASAENQTFVCVGRLCPQKGQVHLPSVVAALRTEFPSIRMILVGDGESRADIEEQIALHNVQNEVTLMGWATNSQVRELISASRALILPSYAEGLPVVIMEAFMMERPVISTTIAGIPELVDAKCGWLVPPGDMKQLLSAMTAALKAPSHEIQSMGHEGRLRVERLHDRDFLGKRLSELFKDAAVNARERVRTFRT
ncbi:glycosyltransferase family 4 protein [Bosea sp. 124]|uniref:glycosyltransferase family 4 protein n=1 Tax=Bosea sp. 124 TaxID=2135642 RepID=UPI000D36AA20|nr:glycosyltransferase family 4 protein [Bosea sp. 124]PTM41491.1 glycosyltransferase involved in cell wall biosynthesis [Bosea sp. 124]